jgi:hypothetical protein
MLLLIDLGSQTYTPTLADAKVMPAAYRKTWAAMHRLATGQNALL